MVRYVSECDKCGKCCATPWPIVLSLKDARKIRALGYTLESFSRINGGYLMLKHNSNGACVLFDTDKLCKLQKEFGFKYKPQVCQEFPYSHFVCGVAKVVKNKHKKRQEMVNSRFFRIGDKWIESNVFVRALKKIDLGKPLFESYMSLIYDIIQNKEDIIIDEVKLSNSDLIISPSIISFIEEVLFRGVSKNWFYKMKKYFGKSIQLNFPVGEVDFIEGEGKLSKKIQNELIEHIAGYFDQSYQDIYYPLKLMTILYFLPKIGFCISKSKNPSIKESFRALALLQSMHRFGKMSNMRLLFGIQIRLSRGLNKGQI